MLNLKLKKRILSFLVSSVVMCSFIPNVNTFAVETNRSYRYGIGDVVEDDDMLKSNDQLLLKKYLLGTSNLSSSQKKTADVKMDGKVNSNDLLMTQKCLLGTSGYDDEAIDSLHVAISNSGNTILKNMRDVIGEFMYKYTYNGYGYEQDTSRNYTINGQTFTGCRTDCSTAVCLALYMSGVLNKGEIEKIIGNTYLTTSQMVNRFNEVKQCTNSGYSISLINITLNATFLYPGDILVYPNGHTSVLVSTTTLGGMPSGLYANNGANIVVYGAGGDFATVHSHRLKPEVEKIDQSSSGNSQGIRPYTHIIRVTRT